MKALDNVNKPPKGTPRVVKGTPRVVKALATRCYSTTFFPKNIKNIKKGEVRAFCPASLFKNKERERPTADKSTPVAGIRFGCFDIDLIGYILGFDLDRPVVGVCPDLMYLVV